MPKRTAPGEWLIKALDERSLTQADLARMVNTHRSAISQLIHGHMELSADMRQRIGRALKIPQDEIPFRSPAKSPSISSASTSAPEPPSTYFALGDEPKAAVLRFIDNSIPDHLLPLLAEKMGYFAPFNIKLQIEKLEKKETQHQAFDPPLAPGELALQCGPWDSDLYHAETRIFLARVNRYTGYALIAKAGTRLPCVSEGRDPESKKAAFRTLMERIFDRKAQENVAFIDDAARNFYELLLALYGDFEGEESVTAVKVPKSGEVAALEALDEIGRCRADFAVGHANDVALARSVEPHYQLLVEFGDIQKIIDVVKDSDLIKRRLEGARKFNRPGRGESGNRSPYDRFKDYYTRRLREVTLDNVWGLNVGCAEAENDPTLQALICRIAGVAYRTVHLLQDPEKQHAALKTILEFTKEDRAERPREGSRFTPITPQYFEMVWHKSYQMTTFEETWEWINGHEYENSSMSPEMKEKRARLKSVMGWMAEKKAKYEALKATIGEAATGSLPSPAEEHLRRAEHHASICNYWDAAFYADKALAAIPSPDTSKEQPHARQRGH